MGSTLGNWIETLESRRHLAHKPYLQQLDGFILDLTATSATGSFFAGDRTQMQFGIGDDSFYGFDPVDDDDEPFSGTYEHSYQFNAYTLLNLSVPRGSTTITFEIGLTWLSQGGGTYNLTLNGSSEAGNFSVGTLPGRGVIRGSVFDDRDGDSRKERGEPYLTGLRVWIDKDKDKKWDKSERFRFTDEHGTYVFKNLPTGLHRVRTGLPTGYRQVAPYTGDYLIALAPSMNVGDNAFAISRTAIISGTTALDADGDSRIDRDEGWALRVWVDLNLDGVLDFNEPHFSGHKSKWSIGGLRPGTYTVRVDAATNRVLLPMGRLHLVTVGTGDVLTGLDFLISR